jgi:hypothetical protein
MKIAHLFFLFGALLFASCKDDDTALPAGATLLKYDGGNASGPILDAGNHEFAVRFPASTLTGLVGKKLTEVQVFVGNVPPKRCVVKLYSAGNASNPGSLFYEKDVSSFLKLLQWNKFSVSQEITGDDLWVAVFVELDTRQQSIGCDSGPRQTNGDWLYSESDQLWRTYEERTSESVNWNIRALIQ